jgi:signal transduction histidine kinase
MSFGAQLDRWRRSLAGRLSLGFALLFAVGFTAIFALLYWTLERQLEAQDYDALQLRLRQYAGIYAESGLDGLRERVTEDSQAPHVRSLFIRLVGREGSVVWGKVPPDWIDADARSVAVPDGWGGWSEQRIYTMRVPRGDQQDLAIVSQALPDGLLMQVGRSTDSRTVLLAPLRRTFLEIGGVVVVVGLGIGFLSAWRATRPLHQVVETARRIIATGALDARVPPPGGRDDVAELVQYFNTVLDRNASLVRSMREALDNVAHDLRTPLTSLRGAAELALIQEGDPAASREALADCVERTDEVLHLLRTLMDVSEAEAGMLRLQKGPCDLREIARQAMDLYAEVAESRELQLMLASGEPVPLVADPVRLRQAVANLVDNALKYTPAGGRVELAAARRDDEAVLLVSDTGPGIPIAEQVRVWERLYRGDHSRSQSGLGLGLSLVRAIVAAHGGQTTVRNAPGGGAVFELRLQAAQAVRPVETGR